MTKISVLVPVHKLEEEYLTRCIESIKNQKVKPNEVLFITSNDKDVIKFCEAVTHVNKSTVISNRGVIFAL